MTINIEVRGWASEIAFGPVSDDTYNYIESEFGGDGDEYLSKLSDGEIPPEHDLSDGVGENLFAILDMGSDHYLAANPDSCFIMVSDEDGEELLNRDLTELPMEEGPKETVKAKNPNHFWYGESEDKGTIYYGSMEIDDPFDPAKLKITIHEVADEDECESFKMVDSIEYDDQSIWTCDDGTDSMDGKSETLRIY